MTNFVHYQQGSENTDRRLSPGIWLDIWRRVQDDPSSVFFDFDDFNNLSQHISDQDTQKYSSYIDTGVTIQQLATLDLSEGESGILEIAGNDADNDEGSIQAGGNTGTEVVISDTAGQDFMVAFEARWKKASIADNALALFVGLGEEGLAATNTLVDNTGEIADKDMLGFRVQHDNGELLDFVYNKEGGTITEAVTDIDTLVADTWVKTGFLYKPSDVNDEIIKPFINGVFTQGNEITSANIAAALFPDGEELARLLATKVGAAAESKFQMDWWAVGMVLC